MYSSGSGLVRRVPGVTEILGRIIMEVGGGFFAE